MTAITFSRVLLLGALLRIALIGYGEYHDLHSDLKYTDVDYRVFSDATGFILRPSTQNSASGPFAGSLPFTLGDPYTRDTYRYTPLLALALLPNEWLHPLWGKVLFSICDLGIAIVIYHIFIHTTALRSKGAATLWIGALWLLNPMVANISTRGSAESVLGMLVFMTLGFLTEGEKWESLAAVSFGLAVHFKIYPVIYSTSVLAWMTRQGRLKGHGVGGSGLLTARQIRFGVVSLTTFLALGGGMYVIWGQPFLENTYLYHITRRDHRHNFSLYFYPIYLSYPGFGASATDSFLASPLVSFVPQMIMSLGSGAILGYATDLPFAWFVQTMAFVNFNKVCTSQYFMWSMWFLPLVLPRMHMSTGRAVTTLSVWVLAQALWLALAYRLEFLGEQVFLPLWTASVVFLVANTFVLIQLIRGFR